MLVNVPPSPIQALFTTEVLHPYEERQAAYTSLKSNASLLPDSQSATEAFEKFENVASTIERYAGEEIVIASFPGVFTHRRGLGTRLVWKDGWVKAYGELALPVCHQRNNCVAWKRVELSEGFLITKLPNCTVRVNLYIPCNQNSSKL